MLVVNLFAGPGAGKSTMAAKVFARLKDAGINCELVTEYAKSRVWKDDSTTLRDQLYVLAKQRHRLVCLEGKVDVAVTDSPILLTWIYGDPLKPLGLEVRDLALEAAKLMKSIDIRLLRKKPYNPSGRLQSETEAIQLDHEIEKLNDGRLGGPLFDDTVPSDDEGLERILEHVYYKLSENCQDSDEVEDLRKAILRE